MIIQNESSPSLFDIDIRYAKADNLTGEALDGYLAQRLYGTQPLFAALEKVARIALGDGLKLLIFDAYRPQKAVNHLVRWTCNDDTRMKQHYYPRIDKKDMLTLGYIANYSGHSRGSAIDLTMMRDGKELDMGTCFDYMDILSYHGAKGLTSIQTENRSKLFTLMAENGFKPYLKEWWHYSLVNEPYTDTYFDVDII